MEQGGNLHAVAQVVSGTDASIGALCSHFSRRIAVATLRSVAVVAAVAVLARADVRPEAGAGVFAHVNPLASHLGSSVIQSVPVWASDVGVVDADVPSRVQWPH